MDERFRKVERLRKKKDLQSAAQRRGISGNYLVLTIRRRECSVSRLGLIVSRRVGGAVERNRAKRRIREVFRRIKSILKEPVDMLVRAKPEIRTAKYQNIAEELKRILYQEKLLDDRNL